MFKLKKLKQAVDFIQRISIVTTGESWGKFYRINLCRTGLRFGKDMHQKFSVLTNIAEIPLFYSVAWTLHRYAHMSSIVYVN